MKTLNRRLAILILVPLVGLLLTSGQSIYYFYTIKSSVAKEVQEVNSLAELSVKMSEAIHELQKERGRVSGFLGSKGQQFSQELTAQQSLSSEKIAALENYLLAFDKNKFGNDFKQELETSLSLLKQVQEMRATIMSQKITTPEVIAYYTKTIGKMVDAIGVMAKLTTNAGISNTITAYASFLLIKENMGIERALLTNVFEQDKFGDGMYKKALEAISAQNNFASVFNQYATDAQNKIFHDTLQGADVERTQVLRELAIKKSAEGGFGVNPSEWFNAMTQKIELAKKIENSLSADILKASTALASNASQALYTALTITLITIVLSVTTALWVTRALVKMLSQITTSLFEGSDQVAAASGQISGSSQTLAEGASEQAASLEETSASLEEIASMTKRNAENAISAKNLASETRAAAETGSSNMQDMNRAMGDIQSASGNISKIIKTIDEIAFQTNILALNAAVEAARAGEAGAGFAVVADEVRNLAQRSALAAKETAEKIEDSISKSANGVVLSGKVAESLVQIVEKASQVDELVAEIATASREQSQGIDQVNTAVTQMDKVTQNNAATAEESASASEELNAQAATLRDIVGELQAIVSGTSQAVDARKHTKGNSHSLKIATDRCLPARSISKKQKVDDFRNF